MTLIDEYGSQSQTEQPPYPYLCQTDKGLTLIGDEGLELCGNLTRMLPRLRPNNLSHEMLVRAAKIKRADKPLTAIDATAGLGEDSLLLAAAGFTVELYERDPTIAALLQDSLVRASTIPELKDIVSRMHFHEGNSIDALHMSDLSYAPDIVLLDPMFPQRRKSASVKKKLQLLQQLERPCEDEKELLDAAIGAHPRKVIIKRPVKGPYLAGIKPSYSIAGKAVRYDCIVIPR